MKFTPRYPSGLPIVTFSETSDPSSTAGLNLLLSSGCRCIMGENVIAISLMVLPFCMVNRSDKKLIEDLSLKPVLA